jgi:hypothetical protein
MSAAEVSAAESVDLIWPPLEPLVRELGKPPVFPSDALGEVLGGMHKLLVESIQSPSALCGQSLLAASTLAAQGHVDVSVDGRQSPVSLFFVTVGASGERKSSTDSQALAPHDRRERELIERFIQDHQDYKINHECWRQERDKINRNKRLTKLERGRELEGIGIEPREPMLPVLKPQEPTYQGLVKSLDGGWPSMGVFSDEGSQFLGGYSMSKENQQATIAGYSKLWDKGEFDRVRAGEGSSKGYGKRVSMHLMVQPVFVGQLFGSEVLVGQGFMSRVLPSFPASNIGNRLHKSVDIKAHSAYQRYTALMSKLLETDMRMESGARNELKPRVLELSATAYAEYVQFHDAIEMLQREGECYSSIRGFASKAAENALRLAGVLAAVDDIECNEIGIDCFRRAVALMDYYLGETQRLASASAVDANLLLAEKVLEWARARSRLFPLSHLYQCGPNAIRSKQRAAQIMAILEGHGLARCISGSIELNGKKHRNVWEVRGLKE